MGVDRTSSWGRVRSDDGAAGVDHQSVAEFEQGSERHLVVRRGWQMVRCADDFVILCRTVEEAREPLTVVTAWTAEAGVRLHPE